MGQVARVVVPGYPHHIMARAIGEAHRRDTRRVNFREDWRGHDWQGRVASYVLDEAHLIAAARYVELNPARARLVKCPANTFGAVPRLISRVKTMIS